MINYDLLLSLQMRADEKDYKKIWVVWQYLTMQGYKLSKRDKTYLSETYDIVESYLDYMINETSKNKADLVKKKKEENAEKNKQRRTQYTMEKIFAGGVASSDFRRRVIEEE